MERWIDFYAEDKDFADKLAGILLPFGWKVHIFCQAVCNFDVEDPPEKAEIQVAHHYIFENVAGALGGLVFTGKEMITIPKTVQGSTDVKQLKKICSRTVRHDFDWYCYMLDELVPIQENVVLIESYDLLRQALDAKRLGGRRQSYIPKIEYRDIERIPTVQTYNKAYKVVDTKTNWWPDSQMRVVGNCSDLHFFVVIQYDTSPLWTGMHFPYVPLFFGHFVLQSKEKLPEKFDGNVALFTGSCKQKPDPPILPIGHTFKKDRGDGINSIIVRKDIKGYYYTAHHFMKTSISEMVPPHQESQYNEYRKSIYHEAYPYHFDPNPSVYDEIQTSPLYLFNKDKGVYGYLPDVVGLGTTTGITNGYNLLAEHPCKKEKPGVYQYQVIDAPNQPLTFGNMIRKEISNVIQADSTGGGKYTEKFHKIGSFEGEIIVEYDMWYDPDRMDVYVGDRLVASTNGYVSGKGALKFWYSSNDEEAGIRLVVIGKVDTTGWNYSIRYTSYEWISENVDSKFTGVGLFKKGERFHSRSDMTV